MMFLQTIRSLIRKARRPVKAAPEIPVAVRPITGLELARLRRVRRSNPAAMLSAWVAVRSHTPEGSFLRAQHAIYRRTAPRDVTAPVPETAIDATTGELLITYASTDHRHPSDTIWDGPAPLLEEQSPVTAEAVFQRQLSNAHGDAAARQLEEQESDLRRIERPLRDLDEQLEQIDRERNEAASARTHAVEDGSRPVAAPLHVPARATIISWRAFEVATIGSEALCTFAALANSAGIDASNLAVEWRTAAPAILGWALASVVIAAILFITSEFATRRIGDAVEHPEHPNRLFRLLTASAALLCVLAAVLVIAELRGRLLSAGQGSWVTTATFVVLALVPIVGGTVAHMHADTLAAARREMLAAVATPDAADVAVVLRSAHEEALIAQRDQLRTEREKVMQTIQDLHTAMHLGEQAIRDVARHETRVVDVWLDSLRAALAVDQKHFERFARARNRTSLLVPAEQPAASTAVIVPLRKRRAS